MRAVHEAPHDRRGAARLGIVLAMVASMFVSMVGVASASHQFTDVGDSHTFHDHISWLAENGVTTGWAEDNTFRPGLDVTRQAMAAFLYRMAGQPAGDWDSNFDDVSEASSFYTEISWAASVGITTGWQPENEFRPGEPITRQAFAAFLFRATGEPAGDWQSDFDDVTTANPFYTEISWMAQEGITTGWQPENEFRPGWNVTRMATAAFLLRFDSAGYEVLPGVPTITNAEIVSDAVATDVATAADVWQLDFSLQMATDVQTSSVFDLEDEDGDVIRVVCGGDTDTTTTDATCLLTDGGDATVDNDRLEITLDEDAVDTNPGTGGDDGIGYPLTIIDTANAVDADNRREVDLNLSADVLVDNEV